jgi:hypothetical protein
MRIRLATVLVVVLALGGSLAAAENPFAGTWKLNPAKSKLTGDTLKFEKTTSGAIRSSASGVSYTFNADGKEYTGPFDETIVWKQIDNSTWETTYRQKGILLTTDTTKLSPDSKTMTVVSKGTKPNGETFQDTVIYGRISGDKGLLGVWKDKEVKVSSPETLEIKPSGQDGLQVTSAGYKWTFEAKFDGKDYPATGPTLPAGITVVLKHTGPRSFEMLIKKSGKPLSRDAYTASQDGRTLTVAGSAVAVNEPYTEIFERQ